MRIVQSNRFSLTLVSTLLLAGCLDISGSDDATDDRSVGRLNFNGISGLTYQTQSQRGQVTENGEFKYYPGETLTFWVGDLKLADVVPAQEFVTLLEFLPEVRSQLTNIAPDSDGLSTHKIAEQQLLENNAQMNLNRFILALNWNTSAAEDEGLDIRDRVIEQLNEALPQVGGTIDFNVSQGEFALDEDGELSPANQLLGEICFHPEDDERCETPPTQSEIDAAESRPIDEEEIEDDVLYKEDLQAKRDRILGAIRSIDDIAPRSAADFMTRELNDITTLIGNRYYLDAYVANHPATDTAIKSLEIKRINGSARISDLDAISTRTQDIVLHSTSWQDAEVEYFVAGEPGGESELILSFRPEDTYRWIRKQLRVVIE
ncbi:organic solvent ABC transporter permease [Marinobacter sp. F4216]|uniref:organic solvent ABC transporter permease n=1 Tax=Marinobacter sp. F4216 TaxID=2874281 RepID=UPI001CC0422F|nr:organic solvent ABC transporter permease [Marinobacter sp. F4216]MBZ2170002.1 organic solvent ABC transporter permease [Marinobacter sp. F4216]